MAAKGLIEKPVYGQWKAKNQFASLQSPREVQTLQTSEPPKTAPAAGNSGEPFGRSASYRETEQPNAAEPAPAAPETVKAGELEIW
jgi:hypothetical protein